MKEKILKSLGYIFCAGLGLLTLILLAIPYLSYVYGYIDNDSIVSSGPNDFSLNLSGYRAMDLWSLGVGGVMTSLLQIFVLIMALLMIAWGVCGILKEFGVFYKFPSKIGKVRSKTISEILLYIYLGLNVLLLIFMIVFTATNYYTYEATYETIYEGFNFSAGIFLTLIFAIGSVVSVILLQKKYPVDEDGESVLYRCEGCGRIANATHNFCYKCGAKIVKEEKQEEKKEEKPKKEKTKKLKQEPQKVQDAENQTEEVDEEV